MAKKGDIPWNKDRKDSEEEKEKKSKVMEKWHRDHPKARKKQSEEMKKWYKDHPHPRKGRPSPMLGKKHSEETKEKIRVGNLGKKRSDETRKKLSILAQNRSLESRQKQSASLKGHNLSEETKKKMSITRKGRPSPMLGKTHSEETKKKISAKTSGKNNPNYGVAHSNESREKISIARNKQTFPIKDTKPEKMVQKGLSSAKISFITQKSFKMSKGYHKVDIFIEPNICIECDGNHWHADPKYPDDAIIIRDRTAKMIRENDKKIVQDLENQGNIVHRFWQTEIEEDLNKCIDKIKKSISQNNNF